MNRPILNFVTSKSHYGKQCFEKNAEIAGQFLFVSRSCVTADLRKPNHYIFRNYYIAMKSFAILKILFRNLFPNRRPSHDTHKFPLSCWEEFQTPFKSHPSNITCITTGLSMISKYVILPQ